MSYYGSWKIDDTLTFSVNTHNASTGAATDADGAPTYRVYEDETATPILTGSMALLDTANTDGFYSEQLTLSAANGFEKGKSYNVYISAAVSSVTGTVSHTFQMEAEVDANVVSDKTGYGLLTATQASIDAILADTNELQTDDVPGLIAALNDPTAVAIADQVWDEAVAGHVGVGSFGEEVQAHALSTEVATAQADLDIITGASGVNLLTATQASIDAIEVDTGTTLQAELDAIQAAVITNAAGADIAADIIAMKAETALIVADTNELQTDDVPGLIAALNDPTAVAIADQVWDEAIAGHVGVGSFGEEVQSHALSTEVATAQADLDIITGASGVNLLSATQASIDAIEVDTGTTLQAELDAIQAAVITNAAGADIAADIAANQTDLNTIIANVAALWTTALTESYAADGVAPTPAQALFLIQQMLTEFAISGTTWTTKKIDGSTSAATFTLDDATTPTSITRAT